MSTNNDGENQNVTAAGTQQPEGIGGWLLLFVIGTFISALWNFIIAAQSGESSFLSSTQVFVTNPAVAVLVGFLGLATGIVLIAVRNNYSVWMARIYMLTYLVGSFIVAITGLEAPSGYYIVNEEGVIIKGIVYAIVFNLIWQSYFIKSRRVKATYKVQTIVEGITQIPVGNSLTSIFNRKAFGINYFIGLGLFIAMALSGFLWSVFYSIWWGSTFEFMSSYFFAFRIPALILYSVLFVLLLHMVKNDWLIALFVGLGTMVISSLMRLLYNGVSFGSIKIISNIEPGNLFFFFFWSFILTVSIILALKTWGLKWWSLALWICIGNLVEGSLSQIISLSLHEGYSFDFVFIPLSFIDGLLLGTAFYLCTYLFLKQRRAEVI
ncbi:MAG: hypothetical protein A2057_17720 [Ignavibacteria bacterium GWA2_35_9]|nr:MAG: hypothetical protein A2057_17720 [Ignavibacteria bacterium GWA2_35_9]OGU52528.1 MAG: hypothetical protein A2080_01775 [Ignavibacteria bacterium GWC2_36_12]OGV05350.1 MAG: hypothetical protein A2330_06530 [Ignavibacteria bacterium RIFOXYB2_FULL_36_7]